MGFPDPRKTSAPPDKDASARLAAEAGDACSLLPESSTNFPIDAPVAHVPLWAFRSATLTVSFA